MKKHSRHIALVLLIFIAYPFVFQTFHILYHDHGHTAGNLPAISGDYHECSSHDHSDNSRGKNNKPEDSPFTVRYTGIYEQSGHDHKHCPLCEHEFAKFSVKSLFYISFKDERFLLVNNYLYQNPSVLYTGNHRSLRAPPPFS
jgi:ABC-type nickel/cobalt efflux system permease component RcnA